MDRKNGHLIKNSFKEKTLSSKSITRDGDSKLYSYNDEQTLEHCRSEDKNKSLGTTGALFHLIKGSLGSGIMTMPYSFMNGGLWTSLVGSIVVGLIYAHCIHIFVYSARVLTTRSKKNSLEFAELTEEAFRAGPPALRPYTRAAKNAVDVGLSVSYYLCCVVYIVFTATSVKQVVELNSDVRLDTRLYILMTSVFLIPLGLVRDLKYLVPFSFLAILALVFGCGFVLYDVLQELPPLSSRPAFTSFDRLPVFLSTLLYSIDGIGTILPVENAMKNPEKFLGTFGVLNMSIVFLTIMNCMMGFFGFLRYGEDTMATITLNISSSYLGQTVKVLVSLNVLCTYGLFFYVPCEIFWRLLAPKIEKVYRDCGQYTMRIILVILSVVIAVAVPDLEPFVNLVGALFASTLILFFPAVIELVTFWGDESYMGPHRWRLYKNGLLILLWAFALITGMKSSIEEIISLYN